MHRLGVARLPVVKGVERVAAAPAARLARGIAVGSNARGAQVVLDVNRSEVFALDAAGHAGPSVAVRTAQDPITPGLVAVDDTGRRALVMSCEEMHGSPSLVLVDLDAKTVEPVHHLDGPGWVTGGFGNKAPLVCEQRLGDEPRFSVLVGGKRVWSVEGMQQPCVPAMLDDHVALLVVCPKPDPMTGTGDGALCALDLVSGTLAPLCPAEGRRVHVDGDSIVVDGGGEIVRAKL
jgi:hypothetical protein